MVFRVNLIDPRDGTECPILDGVTHRPASWPTLDAANKYVAMCDRDNLWNPHARFDFRYGFKVYEYTKGDGDG